MNYGQDTLELINAIRSSGVEHVAVMMRHSARTYDPGIRDFDNPLTDEGRELAREFGRSLPKDVLVRAYSSPIERCVETADLILEGHREGGGETTRRRDIEALGTNHILDSRRFNKMLVKLGLDELYPRWFRGELDPDLLLPSDSLATITAHVVLEKLRRPFGGPQLDLLVSHDMNIYPVRHHLLDQSIEAFGKVLYLDGIAFYETGDGVHIRSHHAAAAPLQVRWTN